MFSGFQKFALTNVRVFPWVKLNVKVLPSTLIKGVIKSFVYKPPSGMYFQKSSTFNASIKIFIFIIGAIFFVQGAIFGFGTKKWIILFYTSIYQQIIINF